MYLVDQVEAAASDLGLSISRDPRDPAVASGSAILLATVKTLFNGRSKFGVAPEGRKIKLGTVLIDDAHACLATVEEQFEIRLPATHPAYGQLFSLFEPSLGQQQPASLLQLKDGDPYGVMLVPPWDWDDQQDRVLQILYPYRDDDHMGWGWPLISSVLPVCRCVFTAGEVQIKPPCPPVGQIPSFVQAKRRLYLTATLADDSVLVTHFGADPACSAAIHPGAADDIGDRMILAPQEVRPDWTDQDIKEYATELARVQRGRHRPVSQPGGILARGRRRRAVRRHLREASSGSSAEHGLVVLVNKYDGVDLPDDACRVLVIDGLPRPTAASTGRGGRARRHRRDGRPPAAAHRAGHGPRNPLPGRLLRRPAARPRLIRRLHDPGDIGHFSPATAAQLQLSRLVAEQLAEGDAEDLRAAVEQCLTRDRGWVRASRNALVGVSYGSGPVAATAAHCAPRR